jgi:hypothetical protein
VIKVGGQFAQGHPEIMSICELLALDEGHPLPALNA